MHPTHLRFIRFLYCIAALALLPPFLPAADSAGAAPPPRAAALVAEVESVVTRLRTEPEDAVRIAVWQALLAKLEAASEAALRPPKILPQDEAIRILKLKTYFDLLPATPPTPAQRSVYCTTLLANACPSVEDPSPADLSPEARLAFMALAAWSRETGLPCFPDPQKPQTPK